MVQQGPEFSAVCAFIVEELHLTVAYSTDGLRLFSEELCLLYQVYGK
jgi:hypothetical protein